MLIGVFALDVNERKFNGFTIGLIPVFGNDEVSTVRFIVTICFESTGARFDFGRILLLLGGCYLLKENRKHQEIYQSLHRQNILFSKISAW